MKSTRALPTGASAVTGTAIDMGNPAGNDFLAECELLLSAPALAVGELANASTMTYDIVQSVNSDMSSPTTLLAGVLVQTGAGGVGAAATTKRIALPSNVSRYIAPKATNSAAADASAKSVTLEVLF